MYVVEIDDLDLEYRWVFKDGVMLTRSETKELSESLGYESESEFYEAHRGNKMIDDYNNEIHRFEGKLKKKK